MHEHIVQMKEPTFKKDSTMINDPNRFKFKASTLFNI